MKLTKCVKTNQPCLKDFTLRQKSQSNKSHKQNTNLIFIQIFNQLTSLEYCKQIETLK